MLTLMHTVALLGIAMNQSTPAILQNVHRIVCLGDSITRQGDRPGGYVWTLRETLQRCYPTQDIRVFGAGISGNRSNDMLERFDRDVLSRKPDLVFISVGVNDVWHGFYDNHPNGDGPKGIPLPTYKDNVGQMVRRAKEAGAKVGILLATPIGEDLGNAENRKLATYNGALQEVASEQGAFVVDLQTAFHRAISELRAVTGVKHNLVTEDGVHMNSLGNRIMASQVLLTLGVTTADIQKVEPQLEQALRQTPDPGPLPNGIDVAMRGIATASSHGENFGPEQAISALGESRWAAANGDYSQHPWWQVDLGSELRLTGIELRFPAVDAWRYKVLLSSDGASWSEAVDASDEYRYARLHRRLFGSSASARYVRIRFTREPNDYNWPSLSHVGVFGG